MPEPARVPPSDVEDTVAKRRADRLAFYETMKEENARLREMLREMKERYATWRSDTRGLQGVTD